MPMMFDACRCFPRKMGFSSKNGVFFLSKHPAIRFQASLPVSFEIIVMLGDWRQGFLLFKGIRFQGSCSSTLMEFGYWIQNSTYNLQSCFHRNHGKKKAWSYLKMRPSLVASFLTTSFFHVSMSVWICNQWCVCLL